MPQDLRVISWYSQSSQRKKDRQQQNEHETPKLTYNNLSLHNQALSQPLETNFQSNAARTGPPIAMRECRTGHSQRTDGGNQLLNQNYNQLFTLRQALDRNAVRIPLYLDDKLIELKTETCIGEPIVI